MNVSLLYSNKDTCQTGLFSPLGLYIYLAGELHYSYQILFMVSSTILFVHSICTTSTHDGIYDNITSSVFSAISLFIALDNTVSRSL